MRIYLDNCVFQDLKKEKYQDLLLMVKEDKSRNIYCFSEAHLFDLSRDKTDNKFSDMVHMEDIAENHCFFFQDRTRFKYLTPTEYYNSFDWESFSSLNDLFAGGDEFTDMFRLLFQSVPLNFNELISPDQLPADMPEDFKELLGKPTNLYEFFQAFMDFTDNLTTEQKKFRELLKYLHKNSLTEKIYESLGIEGYDGERITDPEKFRNSYARHFIKEGQEKSRYDLFIDLYHGLETFGFVKGKPAKQKMMNLVNDARHAFFGASCDLVVSSDADFIRKTKFLYKACEIGTMVIDISELETIIKGLTKQATLTFSDLLKEVGADDLPDRILRTEIDGDTEVAYFMLRRTYFTYFDMLATVETPNGSYFYFTKVPNNYSSGTMVKEIEQVTNRLSVELGKDIHERLTFLTDEINDGKWCGRCWALGEAIIELNYSEKLNLAVYPMAYLENCEMSGPPPSASE